MTVNVSPPYLCPSVFSDKAGLTELLEFFMAYLYITNEITLNDHFTKGWAIWAKI